MLALNRKCQETIKESRLAEPSMALFFTNKAAETVIALGIRVVQKLSRSGRAAAVDVFLQDWTQGKRMIQAATAGYTGCGFQGRGDDLSATPSLCVSRKAA